MASKQVTDRQKAALAVVSTIDTYRARLRVGLAATLAKAAVNPEAADAAMVLANAAGAALSRSTALMVASDEAHAVELSDDAGLRSTRDGAVAVVRDHLVDLREGLVGLYGAAIPAAVGYAGPTPVDPLVLARVAREVAKGLLKDKVLPQPRYRDAKIDVLEESVKLETEADRLERAIVAVADDVRENQVTLTARDSAMAAHDKTFSRTANLLSALFGFAAEAELADRIRPSARRPGRLLSEEGETEAQAEKPKEASDALEQDESGE